MQVFRPWDCAKKRGALFVPCFALQLEVANLALAYNYDMPCTCLLVVVTHIWRLAGHHTLLPYVGHPHSVTSWGFRYSLDLLVDEKGKKKRKMCGRLVCVLHNALI